MLSVSQIFAYGAVLFFVGMPVLFVVYKIIMGNGVKIGKVQIIPKAKRVINREIEEAGEKAKEIEKLINARLEEALASETSHRGCPLSRDIIRLMDSSDEIRASIELLPMKTIREQMKEAENCLVSVRRRLETGIISAIKARMEALELPGSAVEHQDFSKHTHLILDDLGTVLLDEFRTYCRDNGFAEKSEAERIRYVDQKRFQLTEVARDRLNQTWHGQLISREELYKVNQPAIPYIENEIEKLFTVVFRIADDAKAEKLRLEENRARLITEILDGGKN